VVLQARLWLLAARAIAPRDAVVEKDAAGHDRVNRVTYEVAVLEVLCEALGTLNTGPKKNPACVLIAFAIRLLPPVIYE
jgi:hypothetical protein